jgi:hypothetical protein
VSLIVINRRLFENARHKAFDSGGAPGRVVTTSRAVTGTRREKHVRGWRSNTGKPGDLAEVTLAKAVGGAMVRAYQRSDLLDTERSLMQSDGFLTRPAPEVLPLNRRTVPLNPP